MAEPQAVQQQDNAANRSSDQSACSGQLVAAGNGIATCAARQP
jgi:hypothetical protein